MKHAFLALSLAIAAVLLLQVRVRGIDPDEFEHIHAACSVSWGQVPYRDFFEHHGPALYYMLQPILHATGTEPAALWWSRLFFWALGMTTLAATGMLAYRLAGKTAAAVAPILLACTTTFFWKTIEVRPDVPAMLLLTVAACFVIERPKAGLAALLVGFLLGVATLFTQKAIVPGAAMIFSQLTVFYCDRKSVNVGSAHCMMTSLGYCTLAAIGGVGTWTIALALFSTAGASGAFLQGTIYQLWRWPVHQSPLVVLKPTLSADLPLWLAATVAVVASVRTMLSQTEKPESNQQNWRRSVLSLTVLLCFVLGLFIKAVYAQYYLLWFPLAAVVAADWLARCAGDEMTVRRRWALLGLLALLVTVEAALAAYAIHRGPEGALPHLIEQCSAFATGAIAVGLIAVAAVAASICVLRNRLAAAVACLVALGFVYAGLRNLDAICWSNRSQLAALATVDRLVGPDETVFDGFTGLGAFHRHACYYWWLNPYSLNLIEATGREQSLLDCLKRSPPKLVCLDENIETLPGVVTWIERNYRPIEPPLYLRNEPLKGPAREPSY
jgi:4-amino-4-deoxy-L-arabinose transferase-like glycosyltransferase